MSIQPTDNPRDPILDELHATRRRLLEEHGGIAGLAAFLRREEAKSARVFVRPAEPPTPDKAPDSIGHEAGK